MKTKFFIILTALLMLVGIGANAQTKYYWYVGKTKPTSSTKPANNLDTKHSNTSTGWTAVTKKPTKIDVYKENIVNGTWVDTQWYMATPLKWGFVVSSGGYRIGGWDTSLVTIDGVKYIVWKCQTLTDCVNTTLANIPGKYWYAGPSTLTSTTVPGAGGSWPMETTDPEQIGWHTIDGEPSWINTGDLYNDTKINWVLAVPTSLGLNHLSNGWDGVTDFYDVSTVTCADGVEYKVFKQIEPTKRLNLIFTKICGMVRLNKTKYNLEKGKTVTLKATVSPTDLSDKSVTWKSSNTKVATVTSAGKVKGVKAGTATITCTSVMTGAYATCEVTVGYVKLDKTEAIVKKGKTITLTPTVYPSSLTDKSVTWESSNTKVATVTSAGKVKGVKAGTATITCTSVATGLSTTCEVTVGYVKLDQTEVSVLKGKTLTLKATVYPSSLEDKSVTWESSNTKVATVTSAGKVKGVKAGTATITCTSVATGLSTTCKVTVTAPTAYYWYAGATVPTESNINSIATGFETSIPNWSASNPQSIAATNNTSASTYLYYCFPTEWNVITLDVDKKTVMQLVNEGTFIYSEIEYSILRTGRKIAVGTTKNYWAKIGEKSGTRSLDGDDDDVTGIKSLDEALEPYDVYDLSGRKVRHQVNSLDGLPDGIYIVNGRKILKK